MDDFEENAEGEVVVRGHRTSKRNTWKCRGWSPDKLWWQRENHISYRPLSGIVSSFLFLLFHSLSMCARLMCVVPFAVLVHLEGLWSSPQCPWLLHREGLGGGCVHEDARGCRV